MFNSIFTNGVVDITSFILVLVSALGTGIIFTLISLIRSESSKSFNITTALLPAVVSMVIMLVNGNIGAGVAVAGAFSLVRFRSVPGKAKEICIIFISMAMGLAFGMGYILYGMIFGLISAVIMLLLSIFKVFDKNKKENKILRIMIPEDLDYPTIFDDLFEKYLSKVELVKVKSKNMGSMFKLTYYITLKDLSKEKEFIDEIRCRNGNLEITVSREEFKEEL